VSWPAGCSVLFDVDPFVGLSASYIGDGVWSMSSLELDDVSKWAFVASLSSKSSASSGCRFRIVSAEKYLSTPLNIGVGLSFDDMH
jgi:hypothetical protein